jgi:hypothetical protein
VLHLCEVRVLKLLPGAQAFAASLTCVEVAGSATRDLLAGGAPVTLLEDGDGTLHLKGATELPCADADALRAALAAAAGEFRAVQCSLARFRTAEARSERL